MSKTLSVIALPLIAMVLAGCQTQGQNAAAGAVGGAVLGAALSSHGDRATGALLGAAAGAAASTLVGTSPQKGQCVYRNAKGEHYTAPC